MNTPVAYVFGAPVPLQLATEYAALIYVPPPAKRGTAARIESRRDFGGHRRLHGWARNFMVAIVLIIWCKSSFSAPLSFPRAHLVIEYSLLMTLGMAFTGQVLRSIKTRTGDSVSEHPLPAVSRF